jgi:hypothetical protein
LHPGNIYGPMDSWGICTLPEWTHGNLRMDSWAHENSHPANIHGLMDS